MGETGEQHEPPYLRIVTEIRRRIDSGELLPGDRVPSTRQLVAEWGVAMATATKALNTLRTQGWVRSVPGSGTVVSPRLHARRPAEGRESALTRDRIVRSAIALADREGLAAASMRRVAAELGTGAMTLYRYVPDKEELVRLMADTVFVGRPLPDPGPEGWRAKLELAAQAQWRAYRRHSWLAPVVLNSLTSPPVITNGLLLVEWELRALRDLGLDPKPKMRIIVTLNAYVAGIAMSRSLETEYERGSGMTSSQRQATDFGLLERMFASEQLPEFEAVFEKVELSDLDELFEFGLQRHLDGIAAYLGQLHR